jgi:sigma-B regulation protein RsbU (phosphoserine phosphatase)
MTAKKKTARSNTVPGVCADPDLPCGDAEVLAELRVPARPDRLRLLRAGVTAAAEACGFSGDGLCDIVLAVDEACQNVIRHAYKGESEGALVIALLRDAEHLIVLVRDYAPTVDVGAVKSRALDDIRPGGLGVHLMHEVMDECGFLPPPSGQGNLLRMAKRIPN